MTSEALIIVAPSLTTAGSLRVFFTLAGSVTWSVYDSPFTAANWKRPRPSCSVRKVATSAPLESTMTPAMSAGFFESVRASRYTRLVRPATRSPPSGKTAMSNEVTSRGMVLVAVSTTPPSSMVKASVPSPRSMVAGSLSETVQWPLSSRVQGALATSAPSTRATAVIFAPLGTPPSARVVSRVAVRVSPWP